jgi:hypothetical protein
MDDLKTDLEENGVKGTDWTGKAQAKINSGFHIGWGI